MRMSMQITARDVIDGALVENYVILNATWNQIENWFIDGYRVADENPIQGVYDENDVLQSWYQGTSINVSQEGDNVLVQVIYPPRPPEEFADYYPKGVPVLSALVTVSVTMIGGGGGYVEWPLAEEV